jgi:hypothetical protein
MGTFSQLPSHARVWVYGSDKKFTANESLAIQEKLNAFTAAWSSHDMPMKADAAVLYNQVVLIALDEQVNSISGCGIDKSVQLMKDLGLAFQTNFFDRLLIFALEGQELKMYTKASLQEALNSGSLNEDTLVLNTLVKSLGEFEQDGFVRLSTFWMAPQLKFSVRA